jgi:NAD(P)-dependent dehydrogenase (short-subunit alcohol dehydrogenase family)
MDDAHHLNAWLADRNYREEGGTRVMSSILIAGACNGIGRATAAELARRSRRAVATGAHAVRAKGTHIATRKVPASDSLTGPTKAWAVVTGASSGIGREFALALAERGTPVLAVARNGESPRTDTAPRPSEPAVR